MTVAVVREPLFRRAPDCRGSFGDLAGRVGVELGLPPDEEQQAALDAIFAERAPGEPAARHACIVGARQNIKTSTLEIAAATDLLVLGVPEAIWTAHESKTSSKSYADLLPRLIGHAEYAPLVDYRGGRGEERIFLREDPRVSLEYRARSGGSGRGFTTSRLTLDEALYLRAADMGALMPTMLTRRDAQVRYGSSGGFRSSEVLRSLRQRARDGSDPRLFYVEYGAERRPCESDVCSHKFGVEGCALDDRELWWQANSALWCGRIDEENVLDLRRSMPPEEFAREVLVWWDEPTGEAAVLPGWELLIAPTGSLSEPVFGVDVDADRTASVSVAWQRDGLTLVEAACEPLPAHKLPDRVREIAKDRPVAAPSSLLEDLERVDVRVIEVKSSQWPLACSAVVDAVKSQSLRHAGQPALDAAVAALEWAPTSTAGQRAFSLRDSHGAGLALAMTRAIYGLTDVQPGDFYTL